MLLYIHGFNSSPASFKANVLRERLTQLGRAAEFLCPALPDRPAQAMALLENMVHQHDIDSTTLVGSSLGGFYATYLVEKYGMRAVLLNPAISPQTGLRAYLGPQKNLYTGEAYVLTEQHIAELDRLGVPRAADLSRYFLITATGDEVLDFREGVERFRGAKQIIINGSDHGMGDFVHYLDKILVFAGINPLP